MFPKIRTRRSLGCTHVDVRRCFLQAKEEPVPLHLLDTARVACAAAGCRAQVPSPTACNIWTWVNSGQHGPINTSNMANPADHNHAWPQTNAHDAQLRSPQASLATLCQPCLLLLHVCTQTCHHLKLLQVQACTCTTAVQQLHTYFIVDWTPAHIQPHNLQAVMPQHEPATHHFRFIHTCTTVQGLSQTKSHTPAETPAMALEAPHSPAVPPDSMFAHARHARPMQVQALPPTSPTPVVTAPYPWPNPAY